MDKGTLSSSCLVWAPVLHPPSLQTHQKAATQKIKDQGAELHVSYTGKKQDLDVDYVKLLGEEMLLWEYRWGFGFDSSLPLQYDK